MVDPALAISVENAALFGSNPADLAGHSAIDRPAAQHNVDWLTPEQNLRRERMRQNRLLFDGHHRAYYVTENRTQFAPQIVRLQLGNLGLIYVPMNVLRLLSLKSADLLVGELPAVRTQQQSRQDDTDALLTRSNFHRVLYQVAIEASWSGESYFELIRWGGDVYVQHAPAAEIFPVGPLLPNGQYASYVRFATADVGTPEKPIVLLLETTYATGAITRVCWQLDEGKRANRVGLESWPSMQVDGAPLAEAEATGLNAPTLVWVPNELQDGRPVSDYANLLELQDALNSKNSQVAYVLLKHAAPKLAMPEATADASGNAPQNAEAYFFRSKDEIPQYIVWNAQLQAAQEDRAWTLNSLCIAAEMSQVLLGLKEGAAPSAARTLRLEATNSLAKAARKAAYLKPGIVMTIDLAYRWQFGGPISITSEAVGVEMRDGLPDDELDRANVISTLRSCQSLSQEGALEMRGLDPAAAAKELQRLEAEAKAATPSVLMSEPPALPGDATITNTDQSVQEAA